jgi:large subunit ribosomal protein L20
MRVKGGVKSHRKHKKFLELAKGFWRKHGNTIRKAKETLLHAGQYAYNDRKKNKRNFRSLWIVRINAAVRAQGMSYSAFIHKLTEKKIAIDRKILAQVAYERPEVFSNLLEQLK